jgi:hypothetical protein
VGSDDCPQQIRVGSEDCPQQIRVGSEDRLHNCNADVLEGLCSIRAADVPKTIFYYMFGGDRELDLVLSLSGNLLFVFI